MGEIDRRSLSPYKAIRLRFRKKNRVAAPDEASRALTRDVLREVNYAPFGNLV